MTRKISRAVAAISSGKQSQFVPRKLGCAAGLGSCGDYVEGMWRMLQRDVPDDYVLATGEAHSVREFVELAFSEVGVDIVWEGAGIDERGVDARTGTTKVRH